MKILLSTLLLLCLAQTGLARTEADLPKDAVGISAITEAASVSTRPLCPRQQGGGIACIIDGTVVKVKVMLSGCLDQLGTYSYYVKQEDEKLIVYMSAINIHTKSSTKALCYALPTRDITLTLANMFGDVEVRFLK